MTATAPDSQVPPPPGRPAGNAFLSRPPRSTLALLAVSILLPLALFALAALQNRRDVEHAALLRVERTTRILHEHALKVFDTQQLMIDQINERLRTLDWSKPDEVRALRDLLRHLQALMPQVASIVVTDAEGHVRADSEPGPPDATMSYADRDYFRALRARDQPLPYISRAVMGRRSGEPIFTMSARARGPVADRFDGVVSVFINQAYFSDFYRGSEHQFAHLVVLARQDGTILASEPPLAMPVLPPDDLFRDSFAHAPDGPRISASVIEGRRRILGYEKIGGYPVVIGFGVTWQSALAPWRHNIRGYGLVAGLSSLALLAVSGVAIRRIALEGRATARWRRTAALLEAEIGERAKVEEQLRQSQKMEAVGRLTGGIAHDFNNLLTVVMGSLDLLSRRMRDADPRHQALVKNAIDGASRAAALTARLLAFSRQQPLAPKPIDPNALIRDMTHLLQRTLQENVAIEWDLAEDPGAIFADPHQLENAILNLCVNAMDAMPKGGTLTIATRTVADPDVVTIAVADTGTGMPPEVVARAFEPFFTTKPVGKGTGLGLSQVYGFARQSGGDAAIESVPGAGTRITIRLPRLQGAAISQSVGAARAADTRPPSATSATILIVEDEDLVRGFAATALREAGHRVIDAATGAEGLATLRRTSDVDLLFTDVVLKGAMNGRELAEAAAAVRPGLPVLYTTGYTQDAIVHEGRLDDDLNFIGKPFTAGELTAKIEALLARTGELLRTGTA